MTDEIECVPAIWRPMSEAPKDGTWILIRGRNSAGRFMVPIVARWSGGSLPRPGPDYYAWRDSANDKDLTSLSSYAPPGHAVDWTRLPDWEADV